MKKDIGFIILVLVLIGLWLVNCLFWLVFGLSIQKQQGALETLVDGVAMTVELEQSQENKLGDLHRQVLALEKEDERLLAHIKWFVMRRSGTNELRKMEAAVVRLEAAE